MAKMFYSLEEAAQKLGISAEDVKAKIESGELSEFRSGDELVVKREQVDMLAGDTGDGSGIDLSPIDEDDEIGLSDSVLENDGPIIDTGHDSLVIGLDDSTEGDIGLADSSEQPIGLADDDDSTPVGLGDESSSGSIGLDDDAGASGSIGLTDSVTAETSMGTSPGLAPDDSAPGLSSAGSASPSVGGSAAGGSGMGSGMGSGIIDLASESHASGMEIDSPKEQTGISIFDDGLDDVDSSEATLVTDAPVFEADSSSSGSGLLDLTREGDDTSLGVDLLDDGYGSDDSSAGVTSEEGGALFETTTVAESDLAQSAPVMSFQEPYDGAGSGLVGGAALGIVVTMLFVGAIAVLAMMDQPGRVIIEQLGGTMNVGVGEVPIAVLAAAGVVVLGAIIGWVLGKRG